MKKLGLIGGIGPASTVDYYNFIIEGWRKAKSGDSYPAFIVDSIDMTEMLGYLENSDYKRLVMLLLNSIIGMQAAGAEFAAIASNTPHVVYDEVSARSPIPLVSIVKSTVNFAAVQGIKRPLLLGTRFTMSNSFYPAEFKEAGIDCIIPSAEDIKIVHSIIFPKLEDGLVDNADKARLIKLIERYQITHNIDAVVLGCTELPIMLNQNDVALPVINTTRIHAAAIVKFMLMD